MKTSMKISIAAIAVMGVIRFALTIAGVPDSTVKYFSMTAIMIVATLYLAVVSKTHKERLKAAYLLILPYMTIEVLALGYIYPSARTSMVMKGRIRRYAALSLSLCVLDTTAK